MAQFWEFVFLGLGLAAIYGLLGSGIVLIYRGSGVVNFAEGTFALAGAVIFYQLRNAGVDLGVSIAAGIVGVAILGMVVQNLVMRPLRRSSPLSRVIATLAVFIAMEAIATLHYGSSPVLVPQFLPEHTFRVAGVTLLSDHLILFGIAAAVVLGLMWFQQRTLVGLATRAAAQSETSAATLGWSANRLATVNWGLGGALAGAAGVLIVPLTGLLVQNMSLLVIPALAAALLGGFDSFPKTFLGATGIGVIQSLCARYVTQSGVSDAVPFLIIIVVLVVTGRALPLRSHLTDRLPRIGTGVIRPIPLVVGVAVSFVLMIVVFNATWQGAFTVSLELAIVLLSIVVVTGYAGQLSLAQYGLAGLGAYVAGRLISADGWPYWAACIAGVVAAVPIGVAFAVPALRTRGVNLAVVTLGLGVAVNSLLFNNVNYTGGITGTSVGNANLFGLDVDQFNHPGRYAVFVFALFVVCALAVANLRRSMLGRRMIAIRENERAASSLGVSVTAAKLYAFVVGAVLAAVAGEAIAFQFPYVVYANFNPLESINVVAFAVIGGIGFVLGPLIGSTLGPGGVGSLTQGLLNGIQNYLPLIGGVVLIVVLQSDPDGLVSANLAAARAEVKSKAAYLRPEVLVVLAVRRFVMPNVARLVPESVSGRRRRVAERVRNELLSFSERARVAPYDLDVSNLTVRFGGVVAVNDVSLRVGPGEIVGLIGPNGAGKTTVIDAVSGFVRVDAGTLLLGDRPVAGLSVSGRSRAGIGRSWQSLEIFEDITVLENLLIASESSVRGWSHAVRSLLWPGRPRLSAAAVSAVSAFGLEHDLDRRPGDLAYGQRRLLGIARTVATNPSVLLLDEPAAGLSDIESQELGALIEKLAREWGMGILLVEHDVDLVMSICDRIAVLEFGNKIAEGTPAEIRVDSAVVAAYLGVAEDSDAARKAHEDLQPVGLGLVPALGDADLEGSPGPRRRRRRVAPRSLGATSTSLDVDDPVLVAEGLFSGYNDRPVVHDVDLEVRRGEVVALLGPNGAGKTTTLMSLAGLLPPLGGKVSFDGHETHAPLYRRARQGLAFVTETRSVFMGLSTAENLRVGRCDQQAALELFPELIPLMDRKAGALSGGEQQILGLARALSRSPHCLIADELSLGLAPRVATRLLRALRQAADERGVAVLVVEQHVSQALEIADRVYVMRRGSILLSGPPGEIAPQLRDAYLS